MSADTPLMQQYKKIKEEYKNEILMFRLGDFYEMFFEDAKISAKELGLTLTTRNREKDYDVPLAGVPYHSVASYIAKLVEKGYSVAICEQVEDPKTAVGIVKREVTRVITPGTIIDTDFLDKKNNNYIACIKINTAENLVGISYADITTGEFSVFQINGKNFFEKTLGEINKIAPSEIVLDEKTYDEYKTNLQDRTSLEGVKFTKIINVRKAEEYITNHFNIISTETFALKNKEISISASANLLKYIDELQKGNDLTFKQIKYKNIEDIMELNISTQNNLSLVPKRNEEARGTLFGVLDDCMTSIGSRELKKIIKNPYLDIDKIRKKQFYVDYFFKNVLLRESVREKLKEIYDIERIAGKIIYGTENGKDLLSLKESIRKSIEIYKILKEHQEIKDIFELDLETLLDIYNKIEITIDENAPFSIREGEIIKDNFSQELDELRRISKLGKDFILEIEQRERERTGIKGLKIKYNKVFGYFIEITKANQDLVPEDYIRKQTLVNSERYIVQDLKEYEEKVITAKSKIEALEYEVFKKLSSEIKGKIESIYRLSKNISNLDVISNFAHIAVKNSYVKPEMTKENILEIKGGRHPVVEKLISSGDYVKNDVILDNEKNLIILTGPNMSGKSTYMKQIALNIIMAHIGSYVAADYAKIPIIDKIFTRVGASDDLISGQSTFMLEMTEVASILNSATEKSFIVLDEIGRGTSTYDGISIATAITEYIHNNIGAKTIFATHYHELTELEKELEKAVNFRVEVKENGKNIVFLREIVKGGADKSYGIEVARLSGVPNEVLNRSKKILKKLENRKNLIESKIRAEQMMLFGDFSEVDEQEVEEAIIENFSEEENKVLEILKEMDLNSMSPLESLLKLSEMKKILTGGNNE